MIAHSVATNAPSLSFCPNQAAGRKPLSFVDSVTILPISLVDKRTCFLMIPVIILPAEIITLRERTVPAP
jgi:hypothetical protein